MKNLGGIKLEISSPDTGAGRPACSESAGGRVTTLRKIVLAAVLGIGGLSANPATSQIVAQTAPERYNTIELSAEAQREVANDTLSATLYVESNGANAAEVANTLNRAINDALKQSAEVKAVRARSGNHQTWPLYNKAQQPAGCCALL